MSRKEREKYVMLEKLGEDVETGSLGLFCLITRGHRVAATEHHLNDLIVGTATTGSYCRTGRRWMALLAFPCVDAVVRG